MKVAVSSGEDYPALFINEPTDEYELAHAYEIPDEMWMRFVAACQMVHEAEQAILRHVKPQACAEGIQPDWFEHIHGES